MLNSPHKRTKKKKAVSAAIFATSVYTSVLFAAGLLLGYWVTRVFYKRYIEKGPLSLIYIEIGSFKIHLHHWISGLIVLIFLFLGGLDFEFHKFLWGFLCGVIAHDIYDFNDWHHIIVRKQPKSA